MLISFLSLPFFFFNDTATTEIYTLSLHDALPILGSGVALLLDLSHQLFERLVGLRADLRRRRLRCGRHPCDPVLARQVPRSEEHTSELQSRQYLVCRLLLEKKKHSRSPNTRAAAR